MDIDQVTYTLTQLSPYSWYLFRDPAQKSGSTRGDGEHLIAVYHSFHAAIQGTAMKMAKMMGTQIESLNFTAEDRWL